MALVKRLDLNVERYKKKCKIERLYRFIFAIFNPFRADGRYIQLPHPLIPSGVIHIQALRAY